MIGCGFVKKSSFLKCNRALRNLVVSEHCGPRSFLSSILNLSMWCALVTVLVTEASHLDLSVSQKVQRNSSLAFFQSCFEILARLVRNRNGVIRHHRNRWTHERAPSSQKIVWYFHRSPWSEFIFESGICSRYFFGSKFEKRFLWGCFLFERAVYMWLCEWSRLPLCSPYKMFTLSQFDS